MLQQFYARRDDQPFCTGDQRLSVQDVVSYLCRADEEGLNPDNYNLAAIRRLYESVHEKTDLDRSERAVRIARLEMTVTYALLIYTSHLQNGYVPPRWDVRRGNSVQIDDVLAKVTNQGQLRQALEDLLPRHVQYQELKQALRQYREIARRGGWDSLTADATAEQLADRLSETGDVQLPTRGKALTQSELQSGLVHFQRRNGLRETGKLDKQTLAALNIPVQTRIRELEINLERWRWLPRDLGRRYILVDVPAFELEASEDGKRVMKMPVVVGKEYRPTPLFGDLMTYVVLNPFWNVPQSIAKNEILPKLKTDPGYLKRNDFELVPIGGNKVTDAAFASWNNLRLVTLDYRLRQKPRNGNALGRVKFIFPNEFNVYLHDTPDERLFKKIRRDFSHGCIRVSRPLDLAAWVLEDDPEWTRDKLAENMTESVGRSGEEPKEKVIKLISPLPVYILYWTAWVQDDKSVSFRDDLYGLDRKLWESMPPQTARSEEAKHGCEQLLE